jgi:hypothetical protein
MVLECLERVLIVDSFGKHGRDRLGRTGLSRAHTAKTNIRNVNQLPLAAQDAIETAAWQVPPVLKAKRAGLFRAFSASGLGLGPGARRAK